MALFRPAPTQAEIDAAVRAIMSRREERARAEEARVKAAETEKQNRPRDPNAPRVTFMESGFRRFTEEEVEAIARHFRANAARYDDPEIQRLQEERMVAALTADGYKVPEQSPEDRLKLLLARRAAKGN